MFINIEVERIRSNKSRKDLARELGVAQSVLSNWIFKRQPIPAAQLRAMSQLFGGLSVDYLLMER